MPLELTVYQFSALVVAMVGAVTDIFTRKIPNVLTFPTALAAFVMGGLLGGARGLIWSVCGWFVGAAVLVVTMKLVPYGSKRPVAFGDAKLFAAIGAFLGPTLVLLCFFYFCLIYGLIGMMILVRVIPWNKLFAAIATSNIGLLLGTESVEKKRKAPIPVGPAIALGTALAIFLERPTLHFFGF